MNNGATTIQSNLHNPKLPKRTFLLFAVLCVAVAAYFITPRVTHSPQPTLVQQLHGDPEEAEDALVKILANTPSGQMEPMLIQYMNDPSPSTRLAAINALTSYSDPMALATLHCSFTDSSADVRDSALYGIVKNDKANRIRFLASALKDQDTQIRQDAAMEFEHFKNAKTVPVLMGALRDSDPSVVHLATGTLHEITGQPYLIVASDTPAQRGMKVREWYAWWSAAKTHWPSDPSISNAIAIAPLRLDPAPGFTSIDTQNQPISLESQKGKITLLNFWGTWCPLCCSEVPDLIKIDSEYRARGVDVIGLATNEPSTATLADWCKNHKIAYRVALAPDSVLDSYGHIDEVPVSVLIDAEGKIRNRWDGPRDYSTFKLAVDRLLAEQHGQVSVSH